VADSELLGNLRHKIVNFYRIESNPHNGLVADKTQPGSASSIAAIGMGLTVYVIAVERGILLRTEVVERILTLLRFFEASHQGPEPDATGYKGFYYHFLDMQSGIRAYQCELSTVDTAILMAGVLSAASYFTGPTNKEVELRKLAEILYRGVDWQWALDKGATLSHGWKPEIRISSVPMGQGLQRSHHSLRAGPGIAHVSRRAARLQGVDLDV
jgi:hypothetical protein